jgi:hypothetical protein
MRKDTPKDETSPVPDALPSAPSLLSDSAAPDIDFEPPKVHLDFPSVHLEVSLAEAALEGLLDLEAGSVAPEEDLDRFLQVQGTGAARTVSEGAVPKASEDH